MPSSQTSDSLFIALGTSQLPYLVVREEIAEIDEALREVHAPDDSVTIYDGNGSVYPSSFSRYPKAGQIRNVDNGNGDDSDEKIRKFYAHAAAVLSALASQMADIASGMQVVEIGENGSCRCKWCLLGFHT